MYSIEAAEKRTKRQKETISLESLEDLSERDKLLIENAYRRGFYQGWFLCIDAINKGAPTNKLEKFLYGALFRWRYSRHGGKFEIAPTYERIKQNDN